MIWECPVIRLLFRIRENDDGCTDLDSWFEIKDILILQADASFRSTAADRFGEGCTMDSDVYESGDVEPEEPRTVGVFYRTLAVLEIMGKPPCIQKLVYLESPFGCLMVTFFLLVPVVDGTGDTVFHY